MLRRLVALAALLLAVLVLSCQTQPASPPPGERSGGTPEPAVPEEARALVDLAKADLSRRKGLPLERIRLVSLEEVNWPDGSLGFPKPGMVYIQVIIPGYRLVLSDGAQTYEYHTDQGQRVEQGE